MPTRVAVLGGGMAGLTAAYELTRPELKGRYEVDVYQLGWRLGGKGASGVRLENGARIEEHGLHLWFGFYHNAFRLMREVYDALGRSKSVPLHSVETAFAELDTLALWDLIDGRQHPHTLTLPRRRGCPWDPDPEHAMPTFKDIVVEALEWMLETWNDVLGAHEAHDPLLRALAEAKAVGGAGVDAQAIWGRIIDHLREKLDELRARFGDELRTNPRVRLVFTTLDVIAAMAAGIVKDVLPHPDRFGAVDHLEWCEWLERHGASREHTIGASFPERAPLLRAVYDVAFCFPLGDIGCANAAAGTATNDLLRLLFDFRGRFMYRMQAGMGDAVMAPLFEVLRRRCVRFRFFHAVTGFEVGAGKQVEAVDVVEQTAHATAYDPLVSVDGLPCWPSEPLWDQLEPDAKGYGTRYETEPNPEGRAGRQLRRGRDFDALVLAIPVGALDDIGQALMEANPRFRRMVMESETVETQAFQLWTRWDAEQLGYVPEAGAVAAGFVEPLDTYCDMGHLLERERWPAGGPKGLLYGCGVLPAIGIGTPAERAEAGVRELLDGPFRHIWPRAVDPDTGRFRWDVLADPEDREGPERLKAQYFRANSTPWERYVITPALKVKARLPSGCSGFENLSLAGDWTRNGIDGGCVEAAVTSGMQAARALGAEPQIVAEGATWLKPS